MYYPRPYNISYIKHTLAFHSSLTITMAPKVTVFVRGVVPNPLKVLIMLEELGVEYAIIAKVGLNHQPESASVILMGIRA